MGLTYVKVGIANAASLPDGLDAELLTTVRWLNATSVMPCFSTGASPVIFGEKDDSQLLGTVTLEAMGLILDPLKRELRPLPMVLG